MKIFFSENNVDYESYTFSYAIYAIKESNEELTDIYNKGFLPYTGNPKIDAEVFYLARSVRVNLKEFFDNSENRRISRRIDPLNVKMEVFEKSNFDLEGVCFKSFCRAYIEERIGPDQISRERWEYILKRETATHIFKFSTEEKQKGYVLAAVTREVVHYWFAFFDINHLQTHSIGKWIMLSVIRWAKANGKSFVYLGTAYRQGAMYKIRDHRGLEYWNGVHWSNDVNRLKTLCNNDMALKLVDEFKLLSDPNSFLEKVD